MLIEQSSLLALAHEQNNALVKDDEDVVGLTENLSPLQRYCIPEVA